MDMGLKSMDRLKGELSLGTLVKSFWGRIAATWSIVALENAMIAFIPFLIGLSIDGLMAGRLSELFLMAGVLVLLGAVAVARRLFDTRAYGAIRVFLGSVVDEAHLHQTVSTRSARLDLSRELVDFLERDVPEILTSVIQVIVSLVILAIFHPRLGVTSIVVIVGMLVIYGVYHRRFYLLNAQLNTTLENQVTVLNLGRRNAVFRHLREKQKSEVAISDSEAIVYGGIFMLQVAYIAANLVIASGLPELTAGRIFTIATYSWDYVEAALALPLALQSWSRLSEITVRLNNAASVESGAA